MAFVAALQEKGRAVEGHRPWPRVLVDEEAWRQAVLGIAAGEATLFGLWSDGEAVHLALVLVAGLYLPPVLVAWFQHVANMLG